jgi:plastocyanin
MRKLIPGVLAVTAAALTLAATGAAATLTIQIRSTGFAPANLTVTHGDRITFRNVDKTDHQVVSDTGSFASPILHANQSWTAPTFDTAGVFRYHDALHPRFTGKLTVKGPAPAVTVGLSAPIVVYGGTSMLTGAVNSGAANESVELTQQPWGQPSPTQVAIVKTGVGGTYAFTVTPSIYTTYIARWKNVASSSVVAQVAPQVRLLPGAKGWMKALVSAPIAMWHKHVALQRLSRFGQWVNIANLTLGELNGKLFKPSVYLPKGTSKIRVFLSINQAGNGLLAAHSGTQTIVKKQ